MKSMNYYDFITVGYKNPGHFCNFLKLQVFQQLVGLGESNAVPAMTYPSQIVRYRTVLYHQNLFNWYGLDHPVFSFVCGISWSLNLQTTWGS